MSHTPMATKISGFFALQAVDIDGVRTISIVIEWSLKIESLGLKAEVLS